MPANFFGTCGKSESLSPLNINSPLQDLEAALQLLRALVAEVNQGVTEIETLALLYWSQQHVKCPGLQLEFTSPTRLLVRLTFSKERLTLFL